MKKPHFRFRDLKVLTAKICISAAVLLVFALAIALVWWFLPPPLPKSVRLGTGPVDGFYTQFGEALGAGVIRHGVALELVPTAGSRENIDLLLSGEIDIGLVQSGNLRNDEAAALVSIATVFYEPILLVDHVDWLSGHMQGGRIAIGAPGSGTNALTRKLLADQGVRDGEPPGTEFVELGDERAVEALLAGQADTGVFVTPLELPWVQTLFANPNLRVKNFEQAEAFTRRYRYLRRIVIPAGLLDLRAEVPPDDVEVMATTASLVTRPDIHRAVIPLLIESAREQLNQGGWLAAPGQFPSPDGVEAPLAQEALHYFERGPNFLYRWLPFRYAYGTTRLLIVLLPLLTLLYPVLRSMGPLYEWVNQRRVYRWYRVLQGVADDMDPSVNAADLKKIEKKLRWVEDKIRRTHVPARFGANLFGLHVHHKLLVERFEELKRSRTGS